jgi:xylulose-5-phosphate/fructose-6-phosphate phosphoketolase
MLDERKLRQTATEMLANDTGLLAMDAIDRLPQTADRGLALKRRLQDKLGEHRTYIEVHGQDMPEIRDWTWTPARAATA